MSTIYNRDMVKEVSSDNYTGRYSWARKTEKKSGKTHDHQAPPGVPNETAQTIFQKASGGSGSITPYFSFELMHWLLFCSISRRTTAEADPDFPGRTTTRGWICSFIVPSGRRIQKLN